MISRIDNSLPKDLGEPTLAESGTDKKRLKPGDPASGPESKDPAASSDSAPVRMRHLGSRLDLIA